VRILKLSKKNKENYSRYLMFLSLVSVAFAAEGWVGPDIWLASTQWLLVALVLAVFGLYMKEK
jgi:hypothetical protein